MLEIRSNTDRIKLPMAMAMATAKTSTERLKATIAAWCTFVYDTEKEEYVEDFDVAFDFVGEQVKKLGITGFMNMTIKQLGSDNLIPDGEGIAPELEKQIIDAVWS